jgi:hypothetical protein
MAVGKVSRCHEEQSGVKHTMLARLAEEVAANLQRRRCPTRTADAGNAAPVKTGSALEKEGDAPVVRLLCARVVMVRNRRCQ